MNQEVSLVFDIGSGSVGALLAANYIDKPKALWVARNSIPAEASLDAERLRQKVYEALESLAKEARKAAIQKKITSVICTYHVPWHISKHVSLSIKRDIPFSVTKKFLDNIVEEEKRTLLLKIKSDKLFSENVYIADSFITNICLNGYSVADPHQDNVRQFSGSLFFALLEEPMIKKVESTIRKHIRAHHIDHTVSPLAVWTVLRNIMPDASEFLAVVLGEELTEIVISRNNQLENTASFPIGKHTLLRSMIKEGEDYHVALSLTKLHLDKHGEPVWTASIGKHVEKARQSWLDLFAETLRQLSVDSPIPKTILFVSDPQSQKLFAEYLQEKSIDIHNTGNPEKISPVIFGEGALKDLVNAPEGMQRDNILETEILYARALVINNEKHV